MGTLKVNNIEPTSGNSVTVNSELLIKGPGGDIVIGSTGSSNLSASYAATAGCASNVIISTIVPGDTITSVVLVGDQAVGCQSPFIDAGLTYNAATNVLNTTVTTAQTSSYALTAQTASYIDGSNVDGIVANATYATNAVIAEEAVTASYVLQAVSASYAPMTTINNNTNNYLVTATGTANTLNGEATLTFDGSTLAVDYAKITLKEVVNDFTQSIQLANDDGYLSIGQADPMKAAFQVNDYSTNPQIKIGAGNVLDVWMSNYTFGVSGSSVFKGNTQITGSLNVTAGITGSLLGTATTASYVNLTAGPGILIDGLDISSSIVTVNGVFPTNGNVATTLTQVATGTSASLVVSSSGAVTSSLPDGLVWIVSNDLTSSNNGDAYIFHSSSVGAWYPISPLDVPAADARYLKLDGINSPMLGDLNMGAKDLTNVNIMFGTASWAFNAQTASYVAASNVVGTVANAATASYVTTAQTASYVLQAVSASFAQTASYLNTLNQNLTFNGNLTLNGTASITYLDVLYESASVIYSSGSNQFGDAANDTQLLYGTVRIPTGSLTVTGSITVTGGITGSLLGTASYAAQALSASFASTALYIKNAQTASYVLQAVSASFASTASYAHIANIVQETVYDNFLPSGSNISSSAYLNWGINLIPSASGMLDFACRLPNPPLKGRNVTIINTCGLDVHVYPSVNGGSIEGEIDGFAVVPSDGKSYTFICYENPLPGGWVVSNPLPIIGNYDTNNVNFGNLLWENPNPNYFQSASIVDFHFVSNQNYPYPVTTPIQSSITASGIGANNVTFSFANGIPYFGTGIPNPNLPASAYIHSKWYSMNGGGGGGLISNTLRKSPWNAQSQAISPYPSNYVNLTTVGTTAEYQFFNPPPGQPQYDYDSYALNTQFSGGSVIKPTTGTWRRIKKITVTSNISSSFLVNATTDSNYDVYTPGSNPYFVTSGWSAGSPNPITDFFYAPQLLPTLNAPNAPVSYADPSISYQSYQKQGTFVPSVGTYTTSQVGGPGTRVIEITYPENARIAISDFIGSIKLARRNSNLITNNAAFILSYPKVDYWLTRGLGVKVTLLDQYMTIPVGGVLNNLSFRIKVEYQQ